MRILHGFRRILQATSLAVFFALFSINAFAYEIMPIFNWSAEIDGGTVSGVARCGPGSGSTSTSAKSWGSSNWNLQNKGCFCRARDIASVDWTDVPLEYASSTEAQRSYWYGSGGSNSMYPLNSLEECEANCADKCAALFASNASYRNNLCGGNCQIDQGNTTQYTITYNLNGGTGCSNTTYTDSTTLCEPTRDGYTFNGWATTDGGATEYNANANVSGTNLTLYANWTFVGCANGQYFENDTCNTCVSGYTSNGATATSQNDCYIQNTVNCYEYNPYNFGHGVPSYKNQTATCKQYYDDFICILDDSTACDILTLNCDTGYEESSVGYYMMNNINKFEKGYTCSYNREPGECSYGLEPSYSIGFFSDEASINNAVGHFVCTSVPGDPTSFQSRIVPSFEYDPTDSGAYCWAKATSIDGQSINAPWFFKKEYESAEECLQKCGYAEGEELYIILNTFALSVSNKMCGAINYDIIYNLNGGEEIEPGTYTIASAIVNLPTPFKDGYDFAGWYDNEELTGDPIYSFVPDINNLVAKTFWAQWTENEETQCNNQGSPYYWDTDNGVCANEQDECESQGSEYYWDGSTCRDAQIECEEQGPEYYWDDLTGECMNEQDECENDGGYWDDMEGICCASDEHVEGGVCVPDEDPEQDCIDAGGEWDGETCTCPGGQFEDDGMCHEACTGDYVWNGESCACPDDQEDSGDGTCHETCTGDYVWNGESCACPDGQEDNGDGTCHEACTGDYVWNGESCACPDASQNDDGNGHCCASGYGWSDTEVGCVINSETECSAQGTGYFWENDTCNYCDTSYNDSYYGNYWDGETCQDYACDIDTQEWNGNTLRCEQVCPSYGNYIRNADGTKCYETGTNCPAHSQDLFDWGNVAPHLPEPTLQSLDYLETAGTGYDFNNNGTIDENECYTARLNIDNVGALIGKSTDEITDQNILDAGISVDFCKYNPATQNYDLSCTQKALMCNASEFGELNDFNASTQDLINIYAQWMNLSQSDLVNVDSLFRYTPTSAPIYDRCNISETINCATQNPYTFGHGTPVYKNISAPCIRRTNLDECELNDATACDIISLSCETGYEESMTGSFMTNIANKMTHGVICMLDGSNSACNELSKGFGLARFSEDADISSGVGRVACTQLHGDDSSYESRINTAVSFNSFTDGMYCWARVTQIDGTDTNTPWFYMREYDSIEECLNHCGSVDNNQELYDRLYVAGLTLSTKMCVATQYTIKFNLNDGEFPIGVVVPGNYTIESDTITLPAPVREGYTFDGWYDNADLNGTAITNFVPSADNLENKTFYAKWISVAFECTSGKWLHLGDNAKLCLSETKPASHESPVVLKVQVGNNVYYLSATPGADYLPVNEDSTGVKMKMYYKGRTYNVHDESISVF